MASLEYMQAWRAANREKMQAYRRKHHKRHKDKINAETRNRYYMRVFGLTAIQYDAKIASANGVCEICHKGLDKPVLDHNHETGQVRGVLCGNCNTGIGMLGDSPDILASAITYLRRFR